MARQQMDLQAATLRSNAQQIGQLTSAMGNLGNLGNDVGRAIASHPPPTVQATLSHSSVTPGQSMNPREMGLLTRPLPVSLSLQGFSYGPHVQAFQPQPNDKNTRRIDEATHQIIQRCLPPLVQARYEAAHTFGVILCVGEFIIGFAYEVEVRQGHVRKVFRRFW